MIVNIHDKAAYYHAPKCGSRTVIAWTVLIKNPYLIESNPTWFLSSKKGEYKETRDLVSLCRGTPQDWKKNHVPVVESDYRFCIVRDPIERFISGYTNRILFHGALSNSRPNIGEFIENFDVICKGNKGIENHFRPQWFFYGNKEKFHRIYKMSEFEQIKIDLEQLFSVDSLPNLRLQQNGKEEKPILTMKQTERIKEIYSIDYKNYGEFF